MFKLLVWTVVTLGWGHLVIMVWPSVDAAGPKWYCDEYDPHSWDDDCPEPTATPAPPTSTPVPPPTPTPLPDPECGDDPSATGCPDPPTPTAIPTPTVVQPGPTRPPRPTITPLPTRPPRPTNTPVTPAPTNTPVTPAPTNTPVTPTPTYTPTPTPTQVTRPPPPPACTSRVLWVMSIGDKRTHTGNWATWCQRFRIITEYDGQAEVIIDLGGGGLRTELRLHESDLLSTVGAEIGRTRANAEVPTSRDPRLVGRRADGHYLMDARLLNHTWATSGRNLTLTVELREIIPHSGRHQIDRTVAYVFGAMPPGQPGDADDHPSKVVPKSIRYAISIWTNHGGGTWPHTTFCETGCSTNRDGHVVTIKTDPGGNTCGNDAPACVETAWVRDSNNHDHLVDMPLIIENPGTGTEDGADRVYVWTDDHWMHGVRVYPGTSIPGLDIWFYKYLPSVVLHEMGHTMGLTDLDDKSKPYPSIMYWTGQKNFLGAFDLNYLKQVYRKYWD